MLLSRLLSRLPPHACDGSAPCHDVVAVGWVDALAVAAVVLILLAGPFLAVRAAARRRDRADERNVRDGNDSLQVPPWQAWFASTILYLVYAFCLAVVLLVGPAVVARMPSGGPAEMWANVVTGILLSCIGVQVVVDVRRWRAHRRALRKLAGRLAGSGGR